MWPCAVVWLYGRLVAGSCGDCAVLCFCGHMVEWMCGCRVVCRRVVLWTYSRVVVSLSGLVVLWSYGWVDVWLGVVWSYGRVVALTYLRLVVWLCGLDRCVLISLLIKECIRLNILLKSLEQKSIQYEEEIIPLFIYKNILDLDHLLHNFPH